MQKNILVGWKSCDFYFYLNQIKPRAIWTEKKILSNRLNRGFDVSTCREIIILCVPFASWYWQQWCRELTNTKVKSNRNDDPTILLAACIHKVVKVQVASNVRVYRSQFVHKRITDAQVDGRSISLCTDRARNTYVPFERACRQRGLRACTSTLRVCTTIRAKCPVPTKPPTNCTKRSETLDAIIWGLCRNNYEAATPRNQETANLFARGPPIVFVSQIIFADAG